jgi:hypothetical protein
LEVEVMYNWKWFEVTWAWVVKWEVLEKYYSCYYLLFLLQRMLKLQLLVDRILFYQANFISEKRQTSV